MTKLCPRGKAAAKRKFRVYPSAYANAYASKICAGKIKDPSGVKRKDFKGPKPAGKKIGGEAKVKEVAKALHKASGLHKAQANALDKITKANVGVAVEKIKEKEKKDKKKKKYIREPQSRDKMQPSRSMTIDTTTRGLVLGGEVRGAGAAIRGKGFKGVF
jgi:hypothetical protein